MKNTDTLFALRLLLCIAVFTPLSRISAQDTTILQTFQYGNAARSGVFDFPDIEPDSLERIILGYNMRCHNGAAGGCGEWDYSCNTYLTDSTRQDSTPAAQKRYVIAGLDFDNLPVRNQAVHNYIYKPQLEFAFDNISGHYTYGNASSDKSWANAGSVSYKVFPAERLQEQGYTPGYFQQIQFVLEYAGVGKLEVYIDSTDEDVFPEGLLRRNWTYAGSLDMNTSEGTKTLSFAKPFYWSGNKNIVVRVAFKSPINNDFALGIQNLDLEGKDFYSPAGNVFQTASNNAIRMPKNAIESIESQISIGFWAYGSDSSANVHTFFANGADAQGSRNVNIHLPWENNEVYWDCGGANGSFDRINVTTQAQDCRGRWNYWTFTKDAALGIMEIYLNGVKIHSGTGKTQPIHLESLDFLKSPESATGYFGMVDEITVWSLRLNEEQIRATMITGPEYNKPHSASLEAHYTFDFPTPGVIKDLSAHDRDAELIGIPQYISQQRVQSPYLFFPHSLAYSMSLVEFEADRSESARIDYYDSIPQPGALVQEYEKINVSTVAIKDQFATYLPAYSNTYDGDGALISKEWKPATGTLINSTFNYLRTTPAKYQLLSFVTPYGNGLNLGAQGKTWFFDVTDYAPILRGKKFLSMEDGGQNQEEMDLKFYYIKGRPARKVLDITNVYRPGRGYINEIIADKVFGEKTLYLPQADQYVLRAEITGHGQDGEFIPRQHELALNGNAKKEAFTVWKACGGIPVFPQGGTWIFDRAGWCPGDPSDVHKFDITDQVLQTPRQVNVNYGVTGGTAPDMNYLQSIQIVSYDAPTFTTNASILDVIKPSRRVEYSRFNPSCGEIRLTVINRGKDPLNSFEIGYRVGTGDLYTDTWSGHLAFNDTAHITLSRSLFELNTSGAAGILELSLNKPNGLADEYPSDNTRKAEILPTDKLTFPELILEFTTNKVPTDNWYRLIDHTGAVILERNNMQASTYYKDNLKLKAGCYRLEVQDATGDGLAFWFTSAQTGSGSMALKRYLGNILIPAKTFIADFGSYLYYEFTVDEIVAAGQEDVVNRLSAYPNPSTGLLQIEAGASSKPATLTLSDLQGRILQDWQIRAGEDFSHTLNGLQAGMYLLSIRRRGGGMQQMKVVVF